MTERQARQGGGKREDSGLGHWLAASARGDREAFAVLYGSTSPQLFAVLLRTLKRHDLAEEILHDVYMKVWTRAGDYDPAKGTPMVWLVAIARNAALDRLRRGRHEVPFDEAATGALEASAAPGPDPAAAAFAGAEAEALRACLDELEPGPRECVYLAFVEGHTHVELATRLDRPPGTIKSWIRRSLQRLRACLDGA